jgi:hypothetical protein
VEEVILPSNSADAAILAVEVFPVNVVVEEFARAAEVLAHANAAVVAHLRNRLFGVTDETDNRFNRVPIELVAVFLIQEQGAAHQKGRSRKNKNKIQDW